MRIGGIEVACGCVRGDGVKAGGKSLREVTVIAVGLDGRDDGPVHRDGHGRPTKVGERARPAKGLEGQRSGSRDAPGRERYGDRDDAMTGKKLRALNRTGRDLADASDVA